MNLFEGRHMAQFCARCKGVMLGDTPRQIIDGKVYHLSCGWQLEREALRNINPDKGETYADTLPPRSWSDTDIPPRGDAGVASNPQGDVQGHPVPLHWTSNQ